MTDDLLGFTDLELDALGEILNISFGSATAELADVLNVFIHLNIPKIRIIKKKDFLDIISNEISASDSYSIVEQKYHGDFSGLALLVFPYKAENAMLSYFSTEENEQIALGSITELEKEVFMEIGNILIGACIGRLFELLSCRVIYYPPNVLIGTEIKDMYTGDEDSDEICIVLKTRFNFENKEAEGYMFLINNKDSIPRLKNALLPFTGEI